MYNSEELHYLARQLPVLKTKSPVVVGKKDRFIGVGEDLDSKRLC